VNFRATLGQPGVTALVLVLGLAVGALTAAQDIHDRSITACQAQYNNAFAVNIKARSALSDADRAASTAFSAAEISLIVGLFTPQPGLTQAQSAARAESLFATFRQAAKAYQMTESSIDTARGAHPVPQLPSRACR
jgi:hypothetical protein